MTDTSYVVTAPMAIVNLDNGTASHLQRNAVLPPNVQPEHLQHLLDNGIVREGVVAGGLEPVLTGDHSKVLTHPGDGDPDGDGPIPAGNASQEAWAAYAVTQGADPEEVKQVSRDDLRERYGKS